jgi:hypothetical protein
MDAANETMVRRKGAARMPVLDSTITAAAMPELPPAIFRSKRIDADLLGAYTSQNGQPLAGIAARPLFLVFLRHFGCTFCREAVDDISKRRREIEAKGTPLAFVHLGTEEKAQWFFKPYGLLDVPRFSDPDGRLYQAFGLLRAELRQYLNAESILRMLSAWSRGHSGISGRRYSADAWRIFDGPGGNPEGVSAQAGVGPAGLRRARDAELNAP